jgi:hypothetical protein
MRRGDTISLTVDLQAEVEGWRDLDRWGRSQVGADHPPDSFPDTPEFRSTLVRVIEYAASSAGCHAAITTEDAASGERILHPVEAEVSAVLDGPMLAISHCGRPGVSGDLTVEVFAQMSLTRMAEMHLIAAALLDYRPADEDVILHGWRTIVTFNLPLPDITGEELLTFLREHANVPRRWLWLLVRAYFSYADASQLVSAHSDEEVRAVLDATLALLE